MSFDIDKWVRPNIKKLKPYASARDEFKDFNREMVFLDANENPFENGVNRYPDPQQLTLKQAISQRKKIAANQILLGNGSDEVLDLLFRAFCEPGQDNIITLPPTYGMYGVLAATNNIENREIWLGDDFQPQVSNVLKVVDSRSKLLFICSPNNPTGNDVDPSKIEMILNQFSGLVIVDEAYIDFTTRKSWLNRLTEFENLVVVQTLSKAYGMAGIRLGMCFASKEIVAVLNKIKPPYNVNQLTQTRALQGFLQTEQIGKQVQSILKERQRLIEFFTNLPFVENVFPSDANFILIRVDDADLRYGQFISKGIVIRNRSTQPLCENTLRITVGTPEENDTLIKTIKDILAT
ncbi:MAG: histidinol-phosphate transaminase [Bacteroidetes bacterium]|nr:histidinol-phosphate transaminase [Bacteroidota bacterium]